MIVGYGRGRQRRNFEVLNGGIANVFRQGEVGLLREVNLRAYGLYYWQLVL